MTHEIAVRTDSSGTAPAPGAGTEAPPIDTRHRIAGALPVRHPFRRSKLRPRSLAAVAAGALLLAASRPSAGVLALALVPIAVGEALRLWATGYLVKTDRLTVAGPYRHLRHPLYAGTLLIATGFALGAGPPAGPIMAIAFWAFFFGYYFPYKERVESERLARRHGEAFVHYRRLVPALLPRPGRVLRAAPGEDEASWQWARVVDNDELGTLLGVVAAFVLLAARAAL